MSRTENGTRLRTNSEKRFKKFFSTLAVTISCSPMFKNFFVSSIQASETLCRKYESLFAHCDLQDFIDSLLIFLGINVASSYAASLG